MKDEHLRLLIPLSLLSCIKGSERQVVILRIGWSWVCLREVPRHDKPVAFQCFIRECLVQSPKSGYAPCSQFGVSNSKRSPFTPRRFNALMRPRGIFQRNQEHLRICRRIHPLRFRIFTELSVHGEECPR